MLPTRRRGCVHSAPAALHLRAACHQQNHTKTFKAVEVFLQYSAALTHVKQSILWLQRELITGSREVWVFMVKYINVQHLVTSKLAHLKVSFTLNNEQLESEMTLRCHRVHVLHLIQRARCSEMSRTVGNISITSSLLLQKPKHNYSILLYYHY